MTQLLSSEICTGRREHDRFEAEHGIGLYRVSIWDHEIDGWAVYRDDVTLMGLRDVIRGLEFVGWSSVSYLVERQRGPQYLQSKSTSTGVLQ